MHFGVLGGVIVTRGGEQVPLGGQGPRVLLALLLANVNRVVRADRIVEALWPGRPPASANKIVQTYISQLRRVLEPERGSGDWQVLRTRPDGYELAVAPEAIDARQLERALAQARTAEPAEAAQLLRKAFALWRGPAYEGIDRPFAEFEARRLDEVRLTALERCLEAELELGQHRRVVGELEALVADNPLHEGLAELLMLALYRSGRQADALAVFMRTRQRLADELGIDPDPRLVRLHERILRHDEDLLNQHATAAAATVPAFTLHGERDGNLPVERSSFVGRADLLPEVAAELRSHRLVTLVGAGGVGKTRLALRVAAAASAETGGAWWVDLAALANAEHIVEHTLSQLGITDQIGRTPEQTLRSWLAGRRVLLVFDNCEHVVDAAARLVDELLATHPELRILATSREPLRCPGELQRRIPSLGLPEVDEVEAVRRSEAGRLFLERAATSRPHFALDPVNAAAVAQICHRLGGIPLALELAAARLSSMSVQDVAAGLDDRFNLLTSGSRAGLPRHRTLLAATAWSFDLLTPPEQMLLCRLSVLVSSFDVEAASAVAAAEPLEARAIPGLLADLVDRSLIEAWEVEGHARYRLLETVRQFGLERLGVETEDALWRYAEWCAHLSEQVGTGSLVSSGHWYRRLEQDSPHLQAMVAFAVQRGDAERALRISAGAGWAFVINGRCNLQIEWLGRALKLARRTDLDGPVMAQGVLMAGALMSIDQDHDRADALLSEALRRFEALDRADGVAWARYWMAANAAEVGDVDGARRHAREAGDLAERVDEPVIEAYCRMAQAEMELLLMRPGGGPEEALAEAVHAFQRAEQLAWERGLEEAQARVLVGKALLVAQAGEPEAALHACLEGLEAWRRFGRGNRLILGLVAAARIAVLAGRHEQALELVDEGIRLLAGIAWTAPLRAALEVLAICAAPTDPVRAARLLGAATAWPPTHRWPVPLDLGPTEQLVADALEPEAEALLRKRGATLDFNEAVALALASDDAPMPVARGQRL